MIFTEPRFFALFLATFALHWALRRNADRKRLLLLSSAWFYGAWSAAFLGLMYLSVTIDWSIGRLLGRARTERGRRALIVASIFVNLGILGVFKYCNWFVASAAAALAWLGFEPHVSTLEIVLPVGISFYTFQALSYTIDVYRRRIEPVKSYLDFALFVTFFPQLVAGPIVRAFDFLPQLAGPRRWRDVDLRPCLTLFLVGFFKKAVIADHAAGVVDQVFREPAAAGTGGSWLGLVLYHLQIYCDFSGYSDMALAAAGLLGYRLTKNFDFPYFSASIGEFWHRWHISLSSWFRDYLYIPLGGNRTVAWKVQRNLWTVMLLCGLWHGASWTFVAWGALHGLYLSVNRWWSLHVAPENALSRVWSAGGILLTNLIVLLAWAVFRSSDFGALRVLLTNLAGLGPASARPPETLWWGFVGACAIAHVLSRRRTFSALIARAPDWLYAVGYGVAWALVLPFVATGYIPFIYFQF